MKAIVIHEYGPPDVLKYEDAPDPVPRPGEIRIRVHAATVNRVLDVSLRAGKEQYRGPVLPLIPGVDCAGIVDAVGPQVTRWKVGDRAAAAGVMPLNICAEDDHNYSGPQGMMGIKRPGGFAELVCVPAVAGVSIPENLDFQRLNSGAESSQDFSRAKRLIDFPASRFAVRDWEWSRRRTPSTPRRKTFPASRRLRLAVDR